MKEVYAIVTVPAAPVRKLANHRTEMSNQLFFGEAVQIMQNKNGEWLKIKSLYDGYIGWLTPHLITPVDRGDTAIQQSLFLAPKFLTPIQINGQTMQVPLGASLPGLKNKKGIVAGLDYSCKVTPLRTAQIQQKATTLLNNAQAWLNAPYLWGGKTILGVDCSGFAQTMYKLVGVPIFRDAWEQCMQGASVSSLKKAAPGDLAFFEENDKIVHVGILADSGSIIHASGKVRIDRIDRKGIINSDTGKRTHQLKLIKRIL